ncbi:hypothetical protein [Marivita sp.]|uniref:hypothetical protein n=1 Tax=Marivita sp. TaxID=2003365 RepID=UPI0025BB67DD|nr:hypothetical protein [Marivita sp.]
MREDSLQMTFIRPGLRSRIDLFFAEKGQGFNPAVYIRPRLDSILRLEAMSDAELAAFGLTREDILPFVFEDCFAETMHPNPPPDA